MKRYILLLGLLCGIGASAHDILEFDFVTGLKKNVTPRLGFAFEEEFWGRNKISGNDTWFITSFAALPWFTIEPFYCYGTDQQDHHLYRENRYGANFVFSQKVKEWSFQYRSRWSLRDKEIEDHPYIRTRNRIRVRPPWSWTEYGISPYMQYESYFEDKQHMHGNDRFNAHRTAVGISANLTENIYFALFALRHWSRQGDEWQQKNLFGSCVYFTY